jgi:transcriptional regulatory protein RtcR
MSTLASGGRITEDIVAGEMARLRSDWSGYQGQGAESSDTAVLLQVLEGEALEQIDVFDRAQLAAVIRVCRQSKNLAEAGRTLFQVSRTQKTSSNDSHRVRAYLQRFGLTFEQVTAKTQ